MSRLRTGWILFFRSFLIQGSWNYRILLGSGVAWALLPFLGKRSSPEGKDRIARSGSTFNAHPYFAPLALGALVRIDEEGADPDRVSRFRDALRAPLGSLGDGLVWGGWRPFCLLVALFFAVLGKPPAAIVLGFLFLYNLVHFGLRAWGVHVGLERGFAVGDALRSMRLPCWTERIATGGVLGLGLIGGALASRGVETLPNAFAWFAATAVLLFFGVFGGAALGRWAPGFLLLLVISGLLVGPLAPFAG